MMNTPIINGDPRLDWHGQEHGYGFDMPVHNGREIRFTELRSRATA
ncbi:hypothetical protein LV564_07080 [Komagataeibacter nataicola]|nr:hypothetical protein [Komagataeibacter nataicola]WEQ56828.1 hypothetical protein LV564_07080 [Komagataeibacter nataicola]WNM08294.1 hypothetical protein RI056_15645 [Komagataeibacter nataicola]